MIQKMNSKKAIDIIEKILIMRYEVWLLPKDTELL